MSSRRAAPPGDGTPLTPCRRVQQHPRRFPTPNVHERIHAATARAVAANDGGLRTVTAAAICFEAEIPLDIFREHFDDPIEAALSSVESFADAVIADCRAALAAAEDWPEGVWEALGVLLDWGACEPDLARLTTVEMLTLPQGIELLHSLMDAFAIFLGPGYRLLDSDVHPPGALDEAIGTDVLGVVHDHVTHLAERDLAALQSTLARTVLAPFLGDHDAGRLVGEAIARDVGGDRDG